MYKITFILCTLLYIKQKCVFKLRFLFQNALSRISNLPKYPNPNTSNPENSRLGTIDL